MRKYISEFVGTLVLVLVGCGTAVVTGANIMITSLAFGLAIVAMAYSIGNVSGCHVNPAVSLAMLLTGRMSLKDFLFYLLSQFLGAFVGALLLGVILSSFKALGANGFGSDMGAGSAWIAFLVEVLLSFIFIVSILGVTSRLEHSKVAGIVIGLTLTLVHLLGIYFTGTSVNPARSFGPAILQGGKALEQLWVFIIAPMVGSVIAAIFYKFVLRDE